MFRGGFPINDEIAWMAGYGNVANLTHWQPGNKAPRYSKAVAEAMAQCRKLMPEMVDTAIGIVRDESMPPAVRVKCIELIMERGMPKRPDAVSAQVALSGGSLLRIEVIDPSQTDSSDAVTISLNGHGG